MDFETLERSFPHHKKVSEQYADAGALEYLRELVPEDIRRAEKGSLVVELLRWFKNDFMRWLPNQMRCGRCAQTGKDGPVMQSTILPGTSWQLRKIELYRCPSCGCEESYPRYSDVRSIAETRLGRCGEWSILFGAILNSVSIPARIVHDYLDHCWNEALLDGRWVHLDSTLQFPISLDHPHYYEQNWGKQYTCVLAFEPDRLEDVTCRYTEQWETVSRRRLLSRDGKSLAEENLQRLYLAAGL